MNHHLGYESNDKKPKETTNRRKCKQYLSFYTRNNFIYPHNFGRLLYPTFSNLFSPIPILPKNQIVLHIQLHLVKTNRLTVHHGYSFGVTNLQIDHHSYALGQSSAVVVHHSYIVVLIGMPIDYSYTLKIEYNRDFDIGTDNECSTYFPLP